MSVCIPAYGMSGLGKAFLKEAFESLVSQTFQSFEVVVSDQSDDGQLQELCQEFGDRLDIQLVDGRDVQRSASANLNSAIRQARGCVVKVLFQDDFLVHDEALALIAKTFESPSANWLVTGCTHTNDGKEFFNEFVPRYNANIHFGKNTISSPSVLAFRADPEHLFDENLIWLMDVDFYKTCYDKYGEPEILSEVLVANRLHSNQVSKSVDRRLKLSELKYIRSKFLATETSEQRWVYRRRMLKNFIK